MSHQQEDGRHIRCSVCKAYLGVIRDARLRTDIEYACSDCINRLKYQQNDTNNIGKDLFNNIFR